MTLADVLSLARDIAPPNVHPQFVDDAEVRLARAVIDLLGESAPCGWPVVESYSGIGHLTCEQAGCDDPGGMHGHGDRPAVVWCGMTMRPDEARAIAAALMRGADEAEAIGGR